MTGREMLVNEILGLCEQAEKIGHNFTLIEDLPPRKFRLLMSEVCEYLLMPNNANEIDAKIEARRKKGVK